MLYLHLFSSFFHFRLYSTSRISDIAVPRFMLNHCAIFLLFFLREFFDHFFHRVVNKFFDKFVTQVYLSVFRTLIRTTVSF